MASDYMFHSLFLDYTFWGRGVEVLGRECRGRSVELFLRIYCNFFLYDLNDLYIFTSYDSNEIFFTLA